MPSEASYGQGACGFWVMLFIFSKVPELFDTVFLVLHRHDVIFLHWYHHATVLLYCWHSYASRSSAGLYFVSMNYGVHAVMYAWFAVAAVGRKTEAIKRGEKQVAAELAGLEECAVQVARWDADRASTLVAKLRNGKDFSSSSNSSLAATSPSDQKQNAAASSGKKKEKAAMGSGNDSGRGSNSEGVSYAQLASAALVFAAEDVTEGTVPYSSDGESRANDSSTGSSSEGTNSKSKTNELRKRGGGDAPSSPSKKKGDVAARTERESSSSGKNEAALSSSPAYSKKDALHLIATVLFDESFATVATENSLPAPSKLLLAHLASVFVAKRSLSAAERQPEARAWRLLKSPLKTTAPVVTILQISQMFVGIFVCAAVYYFQEVRGVYCDVTHANYMAGLVMYASYAVLFVVFALEKYVTGKSSLERAPPSSASSSSSSRKGKLESPPTTTLASVGSVSPPAAEGR